VRSHRQGYQRLVVEGGLEPANRSIIDRLLCHLSYSTLFPEWTAMRELNPRIQLGRLVPGH
jgi:hypothetical protein